MSKKRKNKKTTNLTQIKNVNFPFSIIDYFLFLIFLVTLFYNQFVTLDKLSNVTNPIASFGGLSNFFDFLSKYGNRIFDNFDLYNFILLIIAVSYFLYRIIKNNLLVAYINNNSFSHKQVIFFLFIISIISLRFYFASGNNIYWGDSAYFVALATSFYNNLKQLNFFPYFSYGLSCGNPFYMEYPPLFPYIGAVLNLIFNNIYFSIKLTMFLVHFLSAVGTYLFVFEISKSKRIAFISAIASILLYFHSHITIYLGRYSSTLGWTIFPFILYFFEKSINTEKLKYYILMSLSIGLLFLSNIGIAYLFILPIIPYFLVKFILLIYKYKSKAYKKIFLTGFFSFIGVIIGLPYLYFISSLLKKYLFSGGTFSAENQIRIVKNIFYAMGVWNNYKIRLFNINFPWQISYWGISILFLSVLGGVYLIKKKRNIELIFMWLFTLFIIIGFGWFPLFKYIPFFYNYSNARFLHIFAMTTIFISGYSYLFLIKKFNKNKVFVLIILCMFLDLFPTTFQDTFGKFYGGNAYPIFQYLKKNFGYKKNKYSNFRVDQIGTGSYYVNQNWRNMNASVTEVSLPFIYDSSRIYGPLGEFGSNFYYKHIYPLMRQKVYLESLQFFKYFYFFNTRFLISSYPLNSTNEFYKKIYKNKNVYLAEFKYYSPVFFSTTIKQFKPTILTNYDCYELLDKYNINFSNNFSKVIFVTNSVSTNIKLNDKFEYKIIEHVVREEKVVFEIETATEIYAQLSYSAYPGTKIFINNKEIKYFESPQGFIVLKLIKGKNRIKILPKPLKSLAFFMWLSRLTFLLIIIILLVNVFRRKRL